MKYALRNPVLLVIIFITINTFFSCAPAKDNKYLAKQKEAFVNAEKEFYQYIDSISANIDSSWMKGIVYDTVEFDYWMQFLTSKKFNPFLDDYTSFNSLPNIKNILKRPLIKDGNPIPLVPNYGADYGRASCNGTNPIILFTLKSKVLASPFAFIFFREHEFAHHRLNHVDCIKKKYTESVETELAADFEAAKVLSTFGEEGRSLIIIAAGIFLEMGSEKRDNYPTGLERHNQLMAYYYGSTQ